MGSDSKYQQCQAGSFVGSEFQDWAIVGWFCLWVLIMGTGPFVGGFLWGSDDSGDQDVPSWFCFGVLTPGIKQYQAGSLMGSESWDRAILGWFYL